jgi:hypothetical protein
MPGLVGATGRETQQFHAAPELPCRCVTVCLGPETTVKIISQLNRSGQET